MEMLSEHEFFIEPKDDFEEGSIPRDHLKYEVIPYKPRSDFDAQIICLHLNSPPIGEILKTFPVPPVFIEYAKCTLPNLNKQYPLISTCRSSSNTDYPNIRYCWMTPSPTLWKNHWIGDRPTVFVTARDLKSYQEFDPLFQKLKTEKIPYDCSTGNKRNLPFKDWQDKFIHNRVLLEAVVKTVSTVVSEAMQIGMPVVVPNFNDNAKMIRNEQDGFCLNLYDRTNLDKVIEILNHFLKDYTFAKDYGERAEKRARECFSISETNKIWNKALEDAISLFKESKRT